MRALRNLAQRILLDEEVQFLFCFFASLCLSDHSACESLNELWTVSTGLFLFINISASHSFLPLGIPPRATTPLPSYTVSDDTFPQLPYQCTGIISLETVGMGTGRRGSGEKRQHNFTRTAKVMNKGSGTPPPGAIPVHF